MSVTSTTMSIDAHFNAGPHSGTERFEAWLRNTIYGTWARKLDASVAGATDPTFGPIVGLPPGIPHDVACRLTRSGAAQVGSTSADPTAWPAGHRQMGVQLLLDNLTDEGSFVADGLGAPGVKFLYGAFTRTLSDSQDLTPHGGGYDQPDWGNPYFEVQWSAAGAGTWAAQTMAFYDHIAAANTNLGKGRWYGDPAIAAYNADLYNLDSDTIGLLIYLDDHSATTIDLRIRRIVKTLDNVTVLQTGNWLVLAGLVIP